MVGVLVLLTACGGSNDGGDKTADAPSAVAPMLLTNDDAPQGYSWNSVADILTDEDGGLGNQLDAAANENKTEPASCSALAPTADSIIGELYENRESAAAVEFLPTDADDSQDPSVIDAVVSTANQGDTVDIATGVVSADDCSQFTRTGSERVRVRPR